MITAWILRKLEVLTGESILLVQDPLRLLCERDGTIHRFASEHGFTVIMTSTNLAFRELLEKVMCSGEHEKLLVIDRAPPRRRTGSSLGKAPPPFYPDLLARTPEKARLRISLRQFLIEETGDPLWPQDVDNPRFARLLAGCIAGVLKAHSNLRAAHPTRFTDHDFRTIVAYSALGLPEAAFKRFEPSNYWRIALIQYKTLEELDSLAPEIGRSIRDEFRTAPEPFCWFADSPPEPIVKFLYLATILAQHTEHWKLLLTCIAPELSTFSSTDVSQVAHAVADLVSFDANRADRNLSEIEDSLSQSALRLMLVDHLKLTSSTRFEQVISRERYSVLIRSLALLIGLDSLLSESPPVAVHQNLSTLLFGQPDSEKRAFVEERQAKVWENLKEAYRLVGVTLGILDDLSDALRVVRAKPLSELSFTWFRTLWNDHRVNLLEYYMSALERLVFSADLLPRSENELPTEFVAIRDRIRERVGLLRHRVHESLSSLNGRYQEMVAQQYKSWVASDSSDVWLTSQFLRRCLKPHWDPPNEKAVVFVFDGMRYDIWAELVKPILEDRMEVIAEYPASSLLPSETHISRKAIFSGAFPDSYDQRSAEDVLVKEALQREFGRVFDVGVVDSEGPGTGEIVRYRADNIEFFIIELCDQELHKISVRTRHDGRRVPTRPLAFIYEQHIKGIVDTELMAIIRDLTPGTKVFVVADHGFGAVGSKPVRIDLLWLNEPNDCNYLNAMLRQTLREGGAPSKVLDNVIELSVHDLRMPAEIETYDRIAKQNRNKRFKSVVFPKTGYALARPNANFRPDAFSHGGVSLQEMMVPMVVLRVKHPEEGWLDLGPVSGPTELIEGEEVEFRMPVRLAKPQGHEEIRVEVQAVYGNEESTPALPSFVQYISASGGDVVCRFVPDVSDASDEERRRGIIDRTLVISVSYREAHRSVRKARSIRFSVCLDSDKIVRRVPAHLGKILGLTPRSLK